MGCLIQNVLLQSNNMTASSSLPRVGDRKFDVLLAIQNHWQGARFGPTVEELRLDVGLESRSTVQFHINDLLRDGYVENIPGKRRSLRTTARGEALIRILTEPN